ncbi:MAG: hypothetical protein M3R08_12000, partial [Bacteroidota bacterium]|nr:hypothetical protein [Bacteroidota bacterium]
MDILHDNGFPTAFGKMSTAFKAARGDRWIFLPVQLGLTDSFDQPTTMIKRFLVICLASLHGMIFLPTASGQTTEDSLLIGQNGWQTAPKFTVGESITGWQPPGKMDGIGARRVGNMIEIFVNHEMAQGEGSTYTLANGLGLKGARITRFLMDEESSNIVSSGLAYDRIFDRWGNVVTTAIKIN